MRPCLNDDEILLFVGGGTAGPNRPAIIDHLGTCSRCRVLVAQTRKALPPSLDEPEIGATVDDHDSEPIKLEHGATVGRYEIGGLLGAGGAGLVYEAFDPQLSRRVALKIVRPDRAGAQAATDAHRLLREARAMAQLSHPSVVAVYDAGTFKDGVFIAMELIEGQTLARWLSRHKPAWQDVVAQFIAAGQGLVAAHAAGLVHRDFKAENVLVGADGRPRVTDFGLARAAHAGDSDHPDGVAGTTTSITGVRSFLLTLTEAAAFAGTPAYMAPEQFRGARADQSTDQFNFCASLYVALYKQRPFASDGERDLSALARAVLSGQLRPAPKDTKVPGALYRILAQGLALQPQDRFASMATLLTALQNIVQPARPARSQRQSRLLWLPVAALAIATVATVLVQRTPKAKQENPLVAMPPPTARVIPPAPVDVQPSATTPPAAAPAPVKPVSRRTKRATQRPKPRSATPKAEPVEHSPPRPLLNGIKDPYAR